jgi:hypothetical protein
LPAARPAGQRNAANKFFIFLKNPDFGLSAVPATGMLGSV